jgi:DNA mismatch repair protein MLH3
MSIPMAKISSSSSVQVSDPASASAPSSTPFSGQTFSRESLARAEFVAQVDRKYLLAKLPVAGERRSPLATTQTLVLVDQHAASERVRVERFLDATVGNVARGESIATIRCGRDEADDPDEAERAPRSVENRIGIVVGRREYELARQYRTVFARWGFTLAFDDDDDEAPPPSPSFSPTTGGDGGGGGDYHQIWLESVPDLVSNRLLTKTKDSHLAQDLVRSFVAHLEGNGPGVAGDVEYTAAGGDGGGGAGRRRGRGGWTSAIKDAPPVLIELLNSKACRGAIMFNDGEPSLLPLVRTLTGMMNLLRVCPIRPLTELSAAQAESLLAKLAETIYPFQCAHGRPSVVPVVNLAPPRPSPAIDPGVDWSRLM